MSGETCPACGSVLDAPEESVDRQLAALIDAGRDSEAAALTVVASLPPAHQSRMLALVRRAAHGIERDRVRKDERASLGTRERFERDMDARRRLLARTFSLGNGIEVAWGEATREQHELRIAMLTHQESGIADTKQRHQLAIEFIDSTPDAKCLNDVADSETLVPVVDDASAEVDPPASSGARKPTTSTNGTRRGRGKPRTADRS